MCCVPSMFPKVYIHKKDFLSPDKYALPFKLEDRCVSKYFSI